jgi:hypothetical protein
MDLGDLAIGFVIAASFLGGFAVFHFINRWRDRRDAGLLRVATRLRGSVATVEGFGLRSVGFLIEGRNASIDFEQRETEQTRVRVSMPRRSPGVFRILRPGDAVGRALLRGVPDVKVGHTAFDRHWFIAARPESLALRIFSQDRLDQVVASVERLARFTSPAIEITRDTLVVRADGYQLREEDLMDLVQTATDFAGYLMRLGPEDGIAWVAGETEEPVLCPVCAAAMVDSVVRCDKCETPHHEECWTYVGRCSTYACKGKRCVT